MGNRVPVVATLEASASLETLEGTLLVVASGQVDEATASVVAPIGLALEKTPAALAAGAPVKVAIIAPGMVIKGKASADASALSGFSGKTVDLAADGRLDVADTTNGCLSVLRTEDAGLTVYCVLTKHAMVG
jgi:hypothetical protein